MEAHAADAADVPTLVETTVPTDPVCIRLAGSRVAVDRLMAHGGFQCGEQRFVFVRP